MTGRPLDRRPSLASERCSMSLPLFQALQRRFDSGSHAPTGARSCGWPWRPREACSASSAQSPSNPTGRPARWSSSGLASPAGVADELATAELPGHRLRGAPSASWRPGPVRYRDVVPGKIIEAGGELVGPNQPTWMAYIKRLQVQSYPRDPGNGPILMNGRTPRTERRSGDLEGDAQTSTIGSTTTPAGCCLPSAQRGGRRRLDSRSMAQWLAEQRDV